MNEETKVLEFQEPLIRGVFGKEYISEDELSEWKTIYIDGQGSRERQWGRLEGLPNEKMPNIFVKTSRWAKLSLKWFFPMVLLFSVGLVIPQESMTPINCVLYPLQLFVSLYGLLSLWNFLCVLGGAVEMGIVKLGA